MELYILSKDNLYKLQKLIAGIYLTISRFSNITIHRF